MMKTKYALFLKLTGSIFALALLAAPSLVTAAVTISQVLVDVGGEQYCDDTQICANVIWKLNGGVTLTDGQTLILTQTGLPFGPVPGENFDTSDRGSQLKGCSNAGGTPCRVQIYINSGNGLLLVNDDNGNANALSLFNTEPTTDESTAAAIAFMEATPWVAAPAFTGSNYTLDLGYSDNVHSNPCPATGCFPQPVWCSFPGAMPTNTCPGAATWFVGAGVVPTFPIGSCGTDANHPLTDSQGHVVNCYDAGALRITAHPPHLTVAKTPKTGTFASGSQLTYTVVVSNDGAAGSVAHNVKLNDTLPGNGGLTWQTATPTQGACTITSNVLHCDLGDIAQGSQVTVTITSTSTTPAAACQDQPNPAANATDNEGDSATDSGDQTCIPPATGIIAPTSTTCEQVRDGTAATLGQINYSVTGGNKIDQNINPGVFFYFTKITVAASTVVTVSEAQNDAAALFQIHQGWDRVYKGDCSSYTTGTQNAALTGASFTLAPGSYIIGIKYSTKSIAGTTAPTSDPVTYTFTATPPGASSSASVLLKKQ
jgi:uncharacterized repeat protein (TIGR01451 family)